MNCITSATETSLRLPDMAMSLNLRAGEPASLPSLSACQLDETLECAQLAILGGEQARGEERRRGVRRKQVEQIAILAAQDWLVIQQLEQHQGPDDVVLHAQRHRRQRPRVTGRPQAQDAVGKRRVD